MGSPLQLSGLKWWKNDEINQKQKSEKQFYCIFVWFFNVYTRSFITVKKTFLAKYSPPFETIAWFLYNKHSVIEATLRRQNLCASFGTSKSKPCYAWLFCLRNLNRFLLIIYYRFIKDNIWNNQCDCICGCISEKMHEEAAPPPHPPKKGGGRLKCTDLTIYADSVANINVNVT